MNAIVAADRNWAIGKDNGLLFSIPTDMRRFQKLITNGTVIMGRKTLDSLPGGRPLPKRRNIVLTHNSAFARERVEFADNIKAALHMAVKENTEKVWVIGGASVYAAMLGQCRKVFLTRVFAEAEGADAFFPNLDADPTWRRLSVSRPVFENGLSFQFVTYERTPNLF